MDIVERLRRHAKQDKHGPLSICYLAADEIERLRAECEASMAEIANLRRDLDRALEQGMRS